MFSTQQKLYLGQMSKKYTDLFPFLFPLPPPIIPGKVCPHFFSGGERQDNISPPPPNFFLAPLSPFIFSLQSLLPLFPTFSRYLINIQQNSFSFFLFFAERPTRVPSSHAISCISCHNDWLKDLPGKKSKCILYFLNVALSLSCHFCHFLLNKKKTVEFSSTPLPFFDRL